MARRPKAGAAAESAVPAGRAHLELFPTLKHPSTMFASRPMNLISEKAERNDGVVKRWSDGVVGGMEWWSDGVVE